MAEQNGRGLATDRSAMGDFYTVLKQSIIDRGLASHEAREEAYAQARRAMVNRLWSYEPPLAEDEIDHRIGQFDIAVARIEDDLAAVFAEMDAQDDAALGIDEDGDTLDDPPPDGADDETDPDYPAVFGGIPGDPGEGEDDAEHHGRRATPRSLDETSLAVERALMGDEAAKDDDEPGPPEARFTAHDEDIAGEAATDDDGDASEPDAERDDTDEDRAATAAATGGARPPAARPKAPARPAGPTLLERARRQAITILPDTEKGQLRLLVGVVGVLALVMVGGLAFVFLPAPAENQGRPPVVLQTEVPGGVSDPDTAIRLPKEAIAVTSVFTLFDGHDPTVFVGDPGNPVRFDGAIARIGTSAGSAGAKVTIGAGLSSRLAGRTVRVTIDARSARESGATSMRFAYESGVAISHWQTANLAADFTELGLVWRVPKLRTNPEGDYIVIEPGIPGSGTAVEIRAVRIDLVDE